MLHPSYSKEYSFFRLAEFEHRYHSRDSRPEDVEAIRELREVVRGQERRMKELVVRP